MFGIFAGVQVAMAGLQVVFMQAATTKVRQLPLFKLVGTSSADILMFLGQVRLLSLALTQNHLQGYFQIRVKFRH